MTTLDELMGRYCDGDAAAFAAIYAEMAPRLLGYLTRLARDRVTAEDLLQQTFLKLHHARAAYVRGADPVPWLYTIAHRTFVDEHRRRRRAVADVARTAGALPEVRAELDGSRADDTVDDAGRDPRVRATVAEALERLPANQREAIVLTKFEGMSHADAAQVLGVSVGAVKLRAHRAFETLRALLQPALSISVHDSRPRPALENQDAD